MSDGARSFTYNGAGRLTSATRAGMTTSYMYNALGQRIQKATATGSTLFAYDEQGHLIGEYDQNGLVQELVWLGDIPVATLRTDQGGTNTGLFYIHTDHLKAPTKITRTTNNEVIWRWDHDPYGNGTPNEDPDGNGLTLAMNLRFPGQYLDSETGLYYNYFRYYDPAIGRYVQSDPIGLDAGQFSTYAYVDGNPVSFIDPYGLYSWDEFMDDATDYSAGFGDTVSFGLTDYIRDQMGTNDVVDKCSDAYGYGSTSGEIDQALLGTGLTAKALGRLSRLQKFRFLNQNRYMRFGLGKPGPGMQKVDMMRVGPSPWNIATPTRAWWTHWRL